jgi:hypothetical protein
MARGLLSPTAVHPDAGRVVNAKVVASASAMAPHTSGCYSAHTFLVLQCRREAAHSGEAHVRAATRGSVAGARD